MKNKNDSIDCILGAHLARIRKNLGLSLEVAAARSNLGTATLSRIERGTTSATAKNLGQLCSTYEITMSRLLMQVETSDVSQVKFREAGVWRDPETGLSRTALCPPNANFNTEISFNELPSGARISYQRPPVEGLEQHVLVLGGALRLSYGSKEYFLGPKDCLSARLRGGTSFVNSSTDKSTYLVITSTAL